MNVTEYSQIVVDPPDASDELIELLTLLDDGPTPDPVWPRVKLIIGRILHPFGIHTWVRWRYYDPTIDRIIDMNGVVCQYCPKAHQT